MPRRKQTKGICSYCGQQIGKAQVTKHLDNCPERKAVLEMAQSQVSSPETLYHLRIQDAYHGVFWLDLEMRGSASLHTLDSYLRAIWLECCDHLSEFTVPGTRQKVAMTRKAGEVFRLNAELNHTYDFGSSTQLVIKVVGTREGRPTTSHPIALLMRNVMPQAECMECEKPATHLCEECIMEHDESGLLCDEHAEQHEHDEYGELARLVNSPRAGVCGYDGPAEPPY